MLVVVMYLKLMGRQYSVLIYMVIPIDRLGIKAAMISPVYWSFFLCWAALSVQAKYLKCLKYFQKIFAEIV